MKVSEIASRAGIGVHTVRFYVRAGLVVPRRNASNNYKQFGEEDVARLRFIKGVQSLGFSLAEIGGLLGRLDAEECTCNEIHHQLADKIRGVRARMEELSQQHAVMQKVYESWNDTTGNDDNIGTLCRFLEQQSSAWPRADLSSSAMPRSKKPKALASSRHKTPHSLPSISSVNVGYHSDSPGMHQMLMKQWASPLPEHVTSQFPDP